MDRLPRTGRSETHLRAVPRVDPDVARDVALLEAIRRRDRSAFGELYDWYAPRILGVLVKILEQRGEAEEVLQDVFWTVWTKPESFDATRASPRVWLFLLSRSRAIDRRRRSGSEPAPMAEVEDVVAAKEDGAALDLAAVETRRQVRLALGRLPKEQTEALSLAFYGGLSHGEVAKKLGIPLGTVKTRIRLGMRSLRWSLAAQWEG